jgi:hypothetical protein
MSYIRTVRRSSMSSSADALTRRGILGRLSAAAVGGGALAATGIVGGGRAAADDGDSFVLGELNYADHSTRLTCYNTDGLNILSYYAGYTGIRAAGSVGVYGSSLSIVNDGIGIYGEAFGGGKPIGVVGEVPSNLPEATGVLGLGKQGTGVRGTVESSGHGVLGEAGVGFGVKGEVTHADGIGVAGSGPGTGVRGEGATGVRGVGVSGGVGISGRAAPYGYGVRGSSDSGFGVLGEVVDGTGVQGSSSTSFGVRGVSTGGTGVRGESQTATGIYGRSVSHTGVTGYGGVYGVVGQCDAGGTAVDGASSNGGTGVWGRSLPTGYGVRGESASGFGVRGDATSGIGVAGAASNGTGVSGQGKLGGDFSGTRAAIRLAPSATAGAPTTGSHARGELVCDKNGGLWFCRTGGVPGTWVRIA